ncbi:MAG TPA: aminotransferase class IV [Oscillospiraceae bacterium]|nr:aminotransferase class IV [Oscillospiraceae bacterium]
MSNSDKKQKEIAKDYFIYNGDVIPRKKFDIEKTTVYPSVYEVIRIIDGVPLFFEEHIERLWNSIKILGYKHPYDNSTIKEHILKLLEINKCYNYNVKIIINALDSKEPNLFVYYVVSNYPADELYKTGIHTILYEAERDDPNVKVIAADFRDKVNKSIEEADAHEALLVNNKGEITEGSRSNIFFVKDDVFYTAPAEDVLVGITRKRIIQLCLKLGYKVVEEPISVGFSENIDGLFMTGTSPKVLPIKSIDDRKYNSGENSAIKAVHDAYNKLIGDYISNNK